MTSNHKPFFESFDISLTKIKVHMLSHRWRMLFKFTISNIFKQCVTFFPFFTQKVFHFDNAQFSDEPAKLKTIN